MIMSIAHFIEILMVKRYSPSTINSYRAALFLVRNKFQRPLKKIDESEFSQGR